MQTGFNMNDYKFGDVFLELSKDIVRSLLESAVLHGAIEIEGKSPKELDAEFKQYLLTFANKRGPVFIQIDHRLEMLSLAREYKKIYKYELACLFYATWVEHWLNGIVSVLATRFGMTHAHVTNIIRDVSLRGKLSWLLKLLGSREIYHSHKNAILKLADLRNAFVHYKWKPIDADEMNADLEFKKIVDSFEKTVKYLQNFESKYVFENSKSKIHGRVEWSRTPPDALNNP